jgi:hypothetical protein
MSIPALRYAGAHSRPYRPHHHKVSSLSRVVKRTIVKAIEDDDLSRLRMRLKNNPKLIDGRQPDSNNTIFHCLAGTSGQDPIALRYGKEPSSEIIHLVLSKIRDVDAINLFDETSLIIACKTNYMKVATALLHLGADPNYVPAIGEPPLHAVMSTSSAHTLNLAEELIHFGANINLLDSKGRTPLSHLIHTQAEEQPININYTKVKWLLSHNASVVTKTEDLYWKCLSDPYLSSTPIKALAFLLWTAHPDRFRL